MSFALLDGLPEESLPPADEQEIAKKILRCRPARVPKLENQLVLHSMREAFFYARKCCRCQLPDGEIYSLAYEALSKATTTFTPKRIRFFAYAKVFIRGGICRVWKSQDVIRRIPKEKMVVADFGLSKTIVALSKVCSKIDDFKFDGGEEQALPLRKNISLPSDFSSQSVEPAFEAIHAQEIWKALEPLIDGKLSEKEAQVIDLRYKKDLTFEEIGAIIGATRSWAQILHARALVKLRGALERSGKKL